MEKIEGLENVLRALEIKEVNYGVCDGADWFGNGKEIDVISPINGRPIVKVIQGNSEDYEHVIQSTQDAFKIWSEVPAPKRGEIVRQFGLELRRLKNPLGKLITIEMGKSIQEGFGEVQEMIDICDLACGQSRMLYGVQTHSERSHHRMYEQWHPLGTVAIITAFNFPVAVWAWNITMATIAGNTCIWKPSSATPLTAIACQKIMQRVLSRKKIPPAVSSIIICKGAEIGNILNHDNRIKLICYTGSCRVGKIIAEAVAKRLGKIILELGGNNASIITKNADFELAAKNVFFGAIGTAGQRCTTTRRVVVESTVYDRFKDILMGYYNKITIGNPLDEHNLMGPLINKQAVTKLMQATEQVEKEGGKIILNPEILKGDKYEGGCYVTPAIAEVQCNLPIVKEETFAPLLYLIKYSGDLKKAIEIQNDVPQGLSSAIFTNNLVESELFLSCAGSDCGIANVNLGTSGAEIGLAFGGEKETGGGRESGSDAWKAYMRRQTNTINWSAETILAQEIKFD